MTTPPLTGTVALVTGAGRERGTGHTIAVALAEAGCDLALHGSGSDPGTWPESEKTSGWRGLDSVADEVLALGRRAFVVHADLRDSAQVDDMVDGVVDSLGRLDTLVNNAAAPRGADRRPVVELSDSQWSNVLDVKLDGAFYCSRAAARRMISQKSGGRIVNISSTAGKRAHRDVAAYAVANAGLQMLGASLSQELGRHRITVNSLSVGAVDSSRIDDLGRGREFDEFIARNNPLQRVGSLKEVADVVVFLCGDGGAFITGQSINVDGGAVAP
ncbi:SDR family NAD(P)-dependent oxidoreductase [Mycetocola zhadangensis]|uniref:SDR family NAD(P)-dependent oxidoreductase n=1 Tax=Mycetocola zhadangensis TaxID=1164595 RepID=UPI003A4E612A